MRRLRNQFFVPLRHGAIQFAILALLLLGVGNAMAQPANDSFSAATDLTFFGVSGTILDSNIGASLETDEPSITGNDGGSSVWYTWTAPSNGIVTVDTIGSDFDTLLGVYLGNSVDALTLVAEDDDSGGSGTSSLTFNAIAGKKYYFVVDGFDGDQGNIVLNWAEVDPTLPSSNDNFASALPLDGDSGTIFDYNLFATSEFFEFAGFFGTNSVWYSFTPSADGVLTVDTHGSTFDTILDVYTGTNTPSFFVAKSENDDFIEKRTSQVSLVVTSGQTYMISVNGYRGAQGFIQLDWNLAPLPPNDNFANATPLAGISGSISDNNVGATAEPNEPTHSGFIATNSLWYSWTAPQDGEVQLDTIGSSFDTVLAVYTGSGLASLNQVSANDDSYTTYQTPGSGSSGQFNVAGQYYDSTNVPVGGFLLISPTNPPPPVLVPIYTGFPYSIIQPFSGLPAGANYGSGASGLRFNAKTGVTYYFAVDGKGFPGFVASSGAFKLSWAYHSGGVFRFATENLDKNAGIPAKQFQFFNGNISQYPGMPLYQVAESESFAYRIGVVNANQFNSTVHTVYNYQQFQAGLLVTVTRVAGSSGRVTVGYSTVDGNQIADHYKIDPITGFLVPDGVLMPLNGDAPAFENVDYTPVSGTLTFDDFEMSKTILIPIIDDEGRSITGVGLPQPNRDFAVVLFDPETDILESANVSQPRLDPVYSQALVRILDADIDPRGPGQAFQSITNIIIDTNTVPPTTNTITFTNTLVSLDATNAVFNFLKANYRIPEDVSDYWGNTPITVYVSRSGTNQAAASCFYTVNGPFLADGFDQQNNEFPLQPGSDYATPDGPPGLRNVVGGIIGHGDAVDFTGTTSGTLSWAAKNFAPKPITFMVNNDKLSEFNEDFHLSIYEIKDDVVRPVGMINETTVTIMVDDEDPPAGSVDQFYNPDFAVNLVPPIGADPIGTEPREHPGTDAQGQVNALVVQGDDNTVIAGNFASYNGVQRHGIARILTTGELDTSFDPGDGINLVGGDFINALGLQRDNKIVVGGSFTSFNGESCGNVVRLNTNGSIDSAFKLATGAGANGTIRAVNVRADGKINIAGDFTSFNGVTRKRVARLNADGSLDLTFDPGNALNAPVYTIAPQVTVPIQILANAGGTDLEYTNIINVGNSSGVLTIDYNFFAVPDDMRIYYGTTNNGPLGLIFDTGMVNGTNHLVIPFGPTNGIVANTIEIVMNQGGGNQGTVWFFTGSVLPDAGPDIFVGGDFTAVGGIVGQDRVAHLFDNGSFDPNFDPASGANDRVRTMIAQVDGKVIVGGDFGLVNGQVVNHITRLNANGSIDSGFFSGIGTDASVYNLKYVPPTIVVTQLLVGTNLTTQYTTNPGTTYFGGPFTLFNGTHRLGFGRMNEDGSLDTSFLDTAYNQFAGLPRPYFSDRPGAVFASGVQSDGNVMIGGAFTQVGGGQFDANIRPGAFSPNQYQEPKVRDGVRNRNNVARLIGGATPGPGNIGLLNGNYPANKSQGFVFPLLTRTNGALGYASANFSVVPGSALAGADYSYYALPPIYPIMWNYQNFGPSRMHSDGLWGTNTVMNDVFGRVVTAGLNGMPSVLVSINNNQLSSGDTHAQFQLANPPSADQFFLGGQNIPLGVGLARSVSPLNIADDSKKPGTFGFTSPIYAASANAVISVMRTNGSFNATPILVDFATSAGSNTFVGVDYFETNGTLTFNNGETLKAFNVRIAQSNYISAIEKTVNLRLFNFPPGSSLGITNAVLRLINPNFQGFLNFTATNYVTNLSAGGIQFTVSRSVGSKGTLDVHFSTANGTATAGQDYVATNGMLHWDDGDVSPKNVTVPFINNGSVGGSKTFGASLFGSTLNGSSDPSLLGSITNTTLTIINDNNYGTFQFSAPTYVVNEATNGFATVTVIRAGSVLSNALVNFTTADGTAHAGANYVATNGALSFVQGQTAASFAVRVLADGVTNVFPLYFNVLLTNVSTGAVLGSPTNAQVNILDAESFNRPPGSGDVTFDQQGINADVLALGLLSDGKIIAGGNFTAVNGIPRNHFARFKGDGSLDTDFLNGLSGANSAVFAVAVQSDQRVVVGGSFSAVDGVVRHGIARVGGDGTLDTSFSPGAGADNTVFALAETFVGGVRKIYVGGAFTLFQGQFLPGIARVNDNGTVDSAFASTGVNGTVYAIAVYPTNSIFAGKMLIGGNFTTVNGVGRTNIARLNADGSLDSSFVANADGIVRALAIQSDCAVVVGGEFSTINGIAVSRMARLNTDGSMDLAFAANIVPGADAAVNAIAIQSDNRIVLCGQFVTANGVTRHHITRLLPSGVVDPTINFGDGANGNIAAVLVQPADQMILIGGAFTQYDSQPAPYLTRIYGGSITGSGAFRFTSAAFQVNENGLQAGITVRRTGGTSGPNPDGSGSVSVNFSTTAGTAVAGINYLNTITNVFFPPGEVLETVFVPILDDLVITSNKTVNLRLSLPSAPAGLGDQTNAVLTIINTDNTVSFASDSFQVAKNIPTGLATVTIIRSGGSSATCTVDFATTTNGTAVIGTDYYPTNMTVTFNPGETVKNIQIGITNNNIPQGDKTITMVLTNIVNSTLASPSNATLVIKDTVFSPGQLMLASTNFFASEDNANATITVLRTNGSSGTVSAFYYTTPGTATPGVNYISVSNIVTFSDGQTNQTFTIPLVDNSLVQGAVSLTVSLVTNFSSGTTLLYPSNALLTIADNDAGFAFVNATNSLRETAGPAAVGVIRIGPTNTTLSVNYLTRDGTATAGTNYTTTTGTLTFLPGQVQKSVVVPILYDSRVTGDLFFTLALTNPTPGSQLAYPSTNTIIVLDADAGLSFTNATMIVRRDAGNAVVTVICTNTSVEPPVINSNSVPLSVQYATSDGTAVAGVDYLTRSGTLVFTNGNGTNTFTVPIINNTASGDRTFNVRLLNPTAPGKLVAPSNQAITIVDGTAGFRFSKATYAVNKTDGFAMINVYRTGLTDSVASIDFTATNGSAISGVHYFATNGTLIFTNGVTNQTFAVQVIDTSAVQPNETVLLQLFNVTNGLLAAPNAATLTIRDNTGSFVVPAGSTIISETGAGAPNGVIDPNETVTALFAFRDAGGLNVGNLNATLVASNGVTPVPNPATQSYGPLIASSHSVSQPFTFTAQGTNGQTVIATFQLKDGVTSIGTALFGYKLGTFTSYYTNGALITINDNDIASPYPSTIAISNQSGTVLKATITLTNMIHGSPGDIDALLVSPGQQTALFMAHAGGQHAISNVSITFDDSAGSKLPQSGQINSGTNQPSAYLPVPVFP